MPLTEAEQLELDLLEDELSEKGGQAVEPDTKPYSKKTQPQNPYKDISMGGSALEGAGQAITFGYGDEAMAGIGAMTDVAGAKLGTRGDISYSDAYSTRKNQAQMFNDASADQNPGSYFGGGLGAGMAMGAVVPGIKPKTVAGGLGLGALYGALSGSGASKENPIDNPAGFGKDVALSAAGGVAGKYAGDKLGNLYKGLKEKSKEKAIDELFRRKSGLAQDVIRFKKEGALGDALTEPGLNGERPIVSRIRRGSDMLDPIRKRIGEYTNKLSTARRDIDAYNLGQGSGDAIVRELRNLEVMKSNFPGDQAAKNQIKETMEYFRGRNDITMEELQRLKDVSLNWKKISGQQQTEKGQDLTNQMNKIVANEQRNVAERGAEMTAIPEMETNLRNYAGNQSKTSALIDAEKAALSEAGKDVANRGVSITDYMTGLGVLSAATSAGMSSGSPTVAGVVGVGLGLSALAVNKFLRERGNTVASRAFMQLSNALDNEGVSAKYMPLIKAAARRGPEAMAILHINLKQKDPEYENQFIGGQP